jgi:DNA-binding CsgD family transcriptional regulator
MRQRVNITPAELRERYTDAGQTLAAIAAELGCSTATVSNMLRRHGIPARPGRFAKHIHIPREVIVQLYCDKRMRIKEIAAQLGVSVGTLYNLRKAYHIPRRAR